MHLQWLHMTAADLAVEHAQALEEGRDLSALEARFARLLAADIDKNPAAQAEAWALVDDVQDAPFLSNHPYDEPDGLDAIRAVRPDDGTRYGAALSDAEWADRFLGAWRGRCAGCLLGKPLEGFMAPHLKALLESQGLNGIDDYLRAPDPEVAKAHAMPVQGWFIDQVDGMPEDDDINYTVLGLRLLQQHGAGFTPDHVAQYWIDRIPLLRTFTAERAAYRNFLLNIAPPASASYRNPYREWIGAQIRTDAYGYLACGDPERAAEWAWRDASISHVKNGIYGAMWVAAMVAAAPFEPDIPSVIRAGLAQIPAKSRLAEAIERVFAWRAEGLSFDAVRARIHGEWTETNSHHWCHTISNAIIVAAALLWGEEDFGATICMAVSCTFDTDCNGATCGSILGIRHGAARLPEQWTAPLRDKIETGLVGYQYLAISQLARETAEERAKLA